MKKYYKFIFLLFFFAGILPRQPEAQENKTLKGSFSDLKKSFKPDKAFIMPFSDTANEDLQAFVFSVRQADGVKGADLKMENGKVVIVVDTKTSMVTMWNRLEKEFRNRYIVTERTPKGFVLADSYQTGAESSTGKNKAMGVDQEQNQKTNTARQVDNNINGPDTSGSNKSVWEQQKEYAEKMRQRDKDRANAIYGKNNNLYYKNPEKYDTTAPKDKGQWYVEYTLNGKRVKIYLAQEKLITLNAGKNVREIHFRMMTPKPYREFNLSITDPAYYPEIRKFEFGKPTIYSKGFKANYVTPEIPTSEHSPVELYFILDITPATSSLDKYHVSTVTGDNKKKLGNITSGFFEVLYFDSRERGILEAKFEFTAKDVGSGWGNKKTDVVVKDGRLRIWVNDLNKNHD